ncbi:metabolite traffic protein EboE [Rubrolithibacter danxiaensis]|uniref:metabolite traffic protein EboE n=1 Tax=Rubrolithibacter danxiaensis TaxID=3390805 RepID=UPI003BF820C4
METLNAHLTYCTNIHAGESWHDHFAALQQNFPAIKKDLSPDNKMGIGLRLSNEASTELIKEGNLNVFKTWLTENGAYVFTMNGFPYGGFHHTRVKDDVHTPDWTTRERVEYTKRLFNILVALLPEGLDGGVSTSPLTYRHWFKPDSQELAEARKTATEHFIEVAEHLIKLKKETGLTLHLDIEPEPDGLLETGAEFIEWFLQDLVPKGQNMLANKFSISLQEAEEALREHIRLCYDICHFAVGYEVHAEVLKELKKQEIKVGKIQISAALKASLRANRNAVKEAFSNFNESTYLHQVVARTNSSGLIRYPDLPQALQDADNPAVEEWRAHFHVPLFIEDLGALQTTQNDISELIKLFNADPFTNHLEVETYTWEVLPEQLKLPIKQSIIRELQWVKGLL